jgi:hypothetical protein
MGIASMTDGLGGAKSPTTDGSEDSQQKSPCKWAESVSVPALELSSAQYDFLPFPRG